MSDDKKPDVNELPNGDRPGNADNEAAKGEAEVNKAEADALKSEGAEGETEAESYEANDDELMKSPDDTEAAYEERAEELPEDTEPEELGVDHNTVHRANTDEKARMEVGGETHDPTQDSVQPEDEELSHAVSDDDLFGVVAEFSEVEDIKVAARKTRDAGYTSIEAYTPFPVEDLDEDLGHEPTRLGWVVLLMGITGGLVGFFTQLYSAAEFYPLNIGGKPLNSWPNFIVITFECTVLFSAFTAGLFMLGRNGLPRPYHPIFNTPNFENATRDRFFLCIEADDPKFELEGAKAFLSDLNPLRVSEVDY